MCREEKMVRKYDFLLPDEFLDKMYLYDKFDIEGLKKILKNEII